MIRLRVPALSLCAILVAGCSSTDAPGTVVAGSSGAAGSGGATGSGGAAGSPNAEAGSDAADARRPDDAARDAVPDSSAPDDVTIADAPSDALGPRPPATLSETGFFKSIGADGGFVLADGVRLYEPRYKLWSDAADKTRWVYLPPGSKIDNTDQDHWSMPVGAKFWKEFAIGGKRIETRLIYHFGAGPDDYLYATYWWKPTDAGSSPADATLVPGETNVANANGTDHDIPFEAQCRRCHDPLKDHVLGFSALQLTPPPSPAPPLAGITIKTLSDEGLLVTPAPNGFQPPGANPVVRDALGYLHANCGNCHNDTPGVMLPEPKLNLRLLVKQQTAAETGAYTTALNAKVTKDDHLPMPLEYRIFGGDIMKSSVSVRMALRGTSDGVVDQDQMPPLATEHPDTTGIATVNAWIKTLPAPPDK